MSIAIRTCSPNRRIWGAHLFRGALRISLQGPRSGQPDPSADSLPAFPAHPLVLLPLDLLVRCGEIFIAPQAIFCCNCSDSANRHTVGRLAWSPALVNAIRKDSVALFVRMEPRVIRRPAFQMWCSKSGLLRPVGIRRPILAASKYARNSGPSPSRVGSISSYPPNYLFVGEER